MPGTLLPIPPFPTNKNIIKMISLQELNLYLQSERKNGQEICSLVLSYIKMAGLSYEEKKKLVCVQAKLRGAMQPLSVRSEVLCPTHFTCFPCCRQCVGCSSTHPKMVKSWFASLLPWSSCYFQFYSPSSGSENSPLNYWVYNTNSKLTYFVWSILNL